MNKISDEKLVSRFLGGDGGAFEELLGRHLKPIYNFIFRLTGDLSAADDLSQETFIKAWKNLKRFDQRKTFKVWLYAIAKNTCYDFLKKKKSIPFSYFKDGRGNSWLDNIPDDNLSPAKILENADLSKDIEKKLKKIPPDYRTTLLLRYKEDFSLTEIADILGKPYNTVKSQHQRALRRLGRLFKTRKHSARQERNAG